MYISGMAVELIIAGIVGFAILGYIYLTWNYSYWTKRGVPQLPKQIPGAGDMIDVLLQRASHDHVPVSYTHLDVYKRQGTCSALR